MKTAGIRKAFLSYFEQNGHTVVPSSAVVPTNDPTLLFTNAGMVQFKEVFLGLEERPYRRATSIQRCVRAGGKHNDLENVGYTARHHTYFEMLGSFSFGDYFKREAIQFAWTFLTNILKLPAEKLWITVYQDDDEAAAIWLNEMHVSPDRLSRCGEKDNFWSMGETGPCGPCSEIFYDHGQAIAGGPPGTAEAEGDRYIEIWNLVFMQYNRDKAGELHPLPRPAVDTGMGLERLAAIMQGVHDNYEIDEFQILIQAILKWVPATDPHAPSLKVIADHLRSSVNLIADGVLPSNEGRGYVLRRIIRRAIRHAHQIGLNSPFFAKLVPILVKSVGADYPLLRDKQQQIESVLTQEEEQFSKTLEQGLRLFQEALTQVKPDQPFPGEIAFKLYDTYGFPLDLTTDLLREKGMVVDSQGFETCMSTQRAQSQAHAAFSAAPLAAVGSEKSEFKGYEMLSLSSAIIGIFMNGEKQTQLTQHEDGQLVLQATPFYAESGGQVGDRGVLECGTARFMVQETQKQGQAILHMGHVVSGTFHVGDTVTAQVDEILRQATRLNHTATHLLHAALKAVLGPSVEQKGSLVAPERARFDFAYPKPLLPSELAKVEALVNQKIRENLVVSTQLMSLEAARQTGAVALFGEKYTDEVRVLSMGNFSKELCGGTHVAQTGEIGFCKLLAEYSIASGVRRIELLTGEAAVAWVHAQMTCLDEITIACKSTREDIKHKVFQLLNDIKEQEKQLVIMRQKLAAQTSGSLLSQVETIGDVACLVAQVEGTDLQGLRTMLDSLKTQLQEAVIVLYTIAVEKIQVVVSVSSALLGQVPAAPILARCLCEKAGGREEMAQGGGNIPPDLSARLTILKEKITRNAK